MKATVTRAFTWHGEEPNGVEIPEGTLVEGACALNAVSMGAAVEVVEASDDEQIVEAPKVTRRNRKS